MKKNKYKQILKTLTSESDLGVFSDLRIYIKKEILELFEQSIQPINWTFERMTMYLRMNDNT